MKDRNTLSYVPVALLAVIAVSYTVAGFHIPFLGDDLAYMHNYAMQTDCDYAFLRSIWRHWLWNNARMADMLNPIGLYMMPAWLRTLSNGLVMASMYALVAYAAVGNIVRRPFAAVAVMFLMAFTFCWDAIWMEYCTFYNYIWATAFAVGALVLILKKIASDSGWYYWLSIPFCFVAAAMHEACGAPLAIAMIVYLIVSRSFKSQNTVGRLMILAFIAGGFFTLTSPASYARVGAMSQPEPVWEILVTSGCFVLLLAAALLWLMMTRREELRQMSHTPWLIFVAAAFISTGFLLLSHYGGRPGWFAQTFALIALFRIPFRFHIGMTLRRVGVVVMGILLSFHFTVTAVWQTRLGSEAEKAIALLKNSDDSIIFMDYTDDRDLPFYVLRQVHGVPDADDSYYLSRLGSVYGNGSPLVILPEDAAGVDWSTFCGEHTFGGRIITDCALPGTYSDIIFESYPRSMLKRGHDEYIEIPFSKAGRRFYLYSPVDRDPGEK